MVKSLLNKGAVLYGQCADDGGNDGADDLRVTLGASGTFLSPDGTSLCGRRCDTLPP